MTQPPSDQRKRSVDPTHNALVGALRQAATDLRAVESWARKEDEGTGYGQPHLLRNDAGRAAERIERALRENAHQDDGYVARDETALAKIEKWKRIAQDRCTCARVCGDTSEESGGVCKELPRG